MSQKRFVQALKERGFDTARGAQGKRLISGLQLKLEPYDEGYPVP
jgi:hypothetical protein